MSKLVFRIVKSFPLVIFSSENFSLNENNYGNNFAFKMVNWGISEKQGKMTVFYF